MRETWNKFVELLNYLAQIFLDSSFLLLWVLMQTGFNRLVDGSLLGLSGIDSVIFRLLQGVFGVSTISVILIALYKDIAIMAKRAKKAIEAA